MTTAPGNLSYIQNGHDTILSRISKQDTVYRTEQHVSNHEGSLPGLSGSVVMRHRGVPESCRTVVSCVDDEDEFFLEVPAVPLELTT